MVVVMMSTTAFAQPSMFDYSFDDPEGDVTFAHWAGGLVSRDGVTMKLTELIDIGIVDIRQGWIIDDGAEVTVGMDVWGEWTEETALPDGVSAIWWKWCLYRETEYFFADYLIIIQWDGMDWKAYFSSGEGQDILWYEELGEDDYCKFENGGSTLAASVPLERVSDVDYWFSEVRVQFRAPPEVPYEWQDGGWFAVDGTDWDNTVSDLPWLPISD